MDDFDILARDFGFRPHGKSVSVKSDGNRPPSSSATVTEDKHMFSDVFGGPPKHTNNNFKSSSAMADLDYDAIFKNPASTNNDEVKSKTTSVKLPVYDDHIFDGLLGSKSKSMSSSALPRYEENIFASMTHKRNQQSDQFDDLMVNSRRTQKIEATKQNRSKSPIGFDNLIPSFGIGRPTTSNRSFDQSTSPPSSSQMADEIWLTVSEIPLFTQPTKSPPPSKPPPPIPKPKNLLPRSHSRKFGNGLSPKHPQSPLSDPPHSLQQMDSVSAMKEAMDRAEAKFRHAKEVREREREREREVTKASRNKDEEREKGKQAAERATKEARERAVQRAQAELAAVGAERAATSRAAHSDGVVDDLSSLFEQFQKVEGETEEKRRARIEREQRTQERTAKALAEKNERDLQSQREQEERNRIGGTLDTEIKRWAFGKEGNLRALLSTLQYVLWPESGWQAVSLTELITGANVKKAYRKATLCIHPDKVQQKGATLQQKYVAEKVFDILKEAWNKFNSEELF